MLHTDAHLSETSSTSFHRLHALTGVEPTSKTVQVPAFVLEPLPSFDPSLTWLAPLIAEIWPKRATEITALFLHGTEGMPAEDDHPMLVRCAGLAVGLSGYYRYDDTSVGLCWHGMAPSHRGLGLSRAVFERVCEQSRQHYPAATTIVELIPSDRDASLVRYFEKLGFAHHGEIATFAYLPSGPTWNVYRSSL